MCEATRVRPSNSSKTFYGAGSTGETAPKDASARGEETGQTGSCSGSEDGPGSEHRVLQRPEEQSPSADPSDVWLSITATTSAAAPTPAATAIPAAGRALCRGDLTADLTGRVRARVYVGVEQARVEQGEQRVS